MLSAYSLAALMDWEGLHYNPTTIWKFCMEFNLFCLQLGIWKAIAGHIGGISKSKEIYLFSLWDDRKLALKSNSCHQFYMIPLKVHVAEPFKEWGDSRHLRNEKSNWSVMIWTVISFIALASLSCCYDIYIELLPTFVVGDKYTVA